MAKKNKALAVLDAQLNTLTSTIESLVAQRDGLILTRATIAKAYERPEARKTVKRVGLKPAADNKQWKPTDPAIALVNATLPAPVA